MVTEAIDFKYLLLDNYKKMQLNEEELATILMIDFLLSQGNKFISNEILSLKMSLSLERLDEILASLIKKGFFEFKSEGKSIMPSLEPLKDKLYHDFQRSLTKDIFTSDNDKNNELCNNIYTEFEKLLERGLSPVEAGKINEWLSIGYDEKTIINALKESISKGKKSLRNVDKILLIWSSRDDIENEGHTTLNKDWDKNLEETIRIAKTQWVKK